jgi:two-component system CheB/CheR fusion protein
MLATILSRHTDMPVVEVVQGMRVVPEQLFIAPPNATMELVDGSFKIERRRNHPSGASLPIDGFFESLARARGPAAVGVVLSGNASDGTRGLAAIKAAGGITLAQTESSATFPGMPQSAIASGFVDFVLPPEEMGRQLSHIATHPLIRSEPKADADKETAEALEEVFSLLRGRTGVDFRHYRKSTILRRLARRMVLLDVQTYGQLLGHLRKNPSEIDALYSDLLINVTSFFRDAATFKFLQRKVFPRFLRRRPAGEPVRFWVPACSTGEEAYSLAIAFLETAGLDRDREVPLQIFATDISESSIRRARAAIYPPSAFQEVPPEQVERFFVKSSAGYRVAKRVRELCVFARQNILADPPFSRLDLLSCRNLFIYLDPTLQKGLYPIFHHVLKPGGVLVLGTSENLSLDQDLFTLLDKKHRVYARKESKGRPLIEVPSKRFGEPTIPFPGGRAPSEAGGSSAELKLETDRLLLEELAPPGVVINDSLEIVYVRGRTGPYLEPATGKADLNLFQMAREGLIPDLRMAIEEAGRTEVRVRREGVRIRQDSRHVDVAFEVIPLRLSSTAGRHFFVTFSTPFGRIAGDRVPAAGSLPDSRPTTTARRARRDLQTARQELASTREYLQTVVERSEAANEELRSANEEVLSSNEELQSTNEELSTAQEELQSSNEELTTLNEELQNRSVEVQRINEDLVNLLTSIQIPILMLSADGRIRRFTPAAARLFNLLPTDTGRPLLDIRSEVEVPDLVLLGQATLRTGQVQDREVQDSEGRWWRLQVFPYPSDGGGNDGFVCTFTDIDSHKKALEEAEARRAFAREIVSKLPQVLLVLESDLRVFSANQTFYDKFTTTEEETVGRRFYELAEGRFDAPGFRRALEELISKHRSLNNFEVEAALPRVGSRTLLLSARQLSLPHGDAPLVLLAIEDITELRRAHLAEKRKLEQELQQLQKLDSIGRLAGGMAHDFNNILNIISSYAERAQRLEDETKRKESLEAIILAVGRGSAVVRQLLTFARKDEGTFRIVDINDVLREVAQMISSSFPRNIRVSLDLAANLPLVHADQNQLHQSFLNICVNARDAMSDGGELLISTQIRRAEEIRDRFPEADQSYYICVSIRDQGVGIDEATRTRVFEPFFTTKGRTGGVGMGLAVVYGVVSSHKGHIEFDSRAGEGTEFRIYLPVFTGLPPESEVERSEESVMPKGTETILFVEDEEMLLNAVRDILEEDGYRVLTASDGKSAIEMYRAHAGEIAIVVSDLELPEMSGWDAFRKMRELDPAIGAILVSGYLESSLRERMIEEGARAFLRKPYTARGILKTIRQVLDQKPARPARGKRPRKR